MWPKGCWSGGADSYLYLRPEPDGRIIIIGGDADPFSFARKF